MAIWLVRAGGHGQFEQKFISEKRIYVTWEGFGQNIAKLEDRTALQQALTVQYPDTKPKAVLNWVSQIWPFAHVMQVGDLIVLPSKTEPVIHIGEITGEYHFEKSGPDPFFHWRPVKWIGEAIPRSHFSQDLLYSFGAFLTICRIQRNNAEQRIAAMRANGWKPETISQAIKSVASDTTEEAATEIDIEELARDQIARAIEAKFKGHSLTRLINAILQAQGYTTYVSPEGADGGADILAGSGPLGFGSLRLCVEVKSETSPIDRPTVDKLLGAVAKFGAHEGLFVSWSGFKSTVYKELAPSFFKVRLWSQRDIIEQLFANYEKLDEEIKAELPLKRVWMVAAQES
jgi:restriction system protein